LEIGNSFGNYEIEQLTDREYLFCLLKIYFVAVKRNPLPIANLLFPLCMIVSSMDAFCGVLHE
jgi:hypothetical protein